MVCFIGDNFAASTYRQHFKKQEGDFYIKNHFKFTAFCNSRFHGSQTNMLARLQNTMASAINGSKNGMLPQYFVIVLDDDLVSYLNYKKEGAATMLGTWVEWLAREFSDLVKKRLDQLPIKCKKTEPFLYWVTAPTQLFLKGEEPGKN